MFGGGGVWWGGVFFFQAEVGIRVRVRSRGLGDVYKRQFLQRVLGAADHSPQPWHALLADLPVSHFVTTAYDNLLARALRAGSRPFDHLVPAGQGALRLSLIHI